MRSGTMLAHQAATSTNGHTLYNSSALPKRSASTATRRSSTKVLRNLRPGRPLTDGTGTPGPTVAMGETVPVNSMPTTPPRSRCLNRPRRRSQQPPHDRNSPSPASTGFFEGKLRRQQEKERDREVEKEKERKRGRGKLKGFVDMLRRMAAGGGSGSRSGSGSGSRSGGSRSSR